MERLQDALERLTPLLDQLPIGVQLIDGALRYRYLNRVAAAHSKRPPAQLLGQTMLQCYPGLETTDLFRRINETLAGGGPCEMENFFEFPDGSEGWFELRMFKLHDGIAICSVDITRRKLLQLHHRHSQRMDATRQFAGGIAHDFNNLLTIVGAYTDLVLQEPNLSLEQREDLGQVLEASDRATALTHRLLALSRHAKGEARRFDLESWLRALARTLAPTLGQAISLRLVVDGELGEIEIDPTALEQVMVSLALNAKDAMSGSGTLHIEARPIAIEADDYLPDSPAPSSRKFCEVAVIDHGPGIVPELLDRVFDPQLQGVERVGTGLGLATCWSIIEQAGGTIHVDSKVGSGSSFRLVLPQPEPAVHEPELVTDAPLRRAERRAKVLVADDEAPILQAIIRQLERAGHSAVGVSDGAEALERLHESDFDLVVSDVLMPVMGGVELARQLAERGRLVPVLLISGYVPEQAMAEKRWPLLQKPFTNDMLLDAVNRLLYFNDANGMRRG